MGVYRKIIPVILLLISGLKSDDYEVKKEIITFEKPYAVLTSPLIDSIKVLKDSYEVPYKLKGDTVLPLIPLKKEDTLYVIYSSFFYKKDTTIFKIKPFLPEERESKEKKFLEFEEGINFSGEKTLSAGFTESGFRIDQSLHFEIDGEITEGYRVKGIVSDESYPEGEEFTRNLSELEEASIKFEGPEIQAKIGEFRLKSHFNRNFKKEILGLELNYNTERNIFSFVLGYPKGKFKTIYIELDKNDLNTFTIIDPLKERIVPGSERVYLDGKLLKKGRENDYIIDYSRGIITLTPNVSYTLNSRLRIDFEVTEDAYQSYTVFSETSKKFKNFKISFMYFNESDIPSMPRFLLSDADKEELKKRADTSWILLNGIVYVDSGKGDYILRNDTLIYVGKNKGNINPQFVFVGPSKGDYDYVEEKNYFIYVGEGNGSYVVGKWGITPKRNQNFIIAFDSENKFLKANLKTGFSLYNPNLFSKGKMEGFFNDFRLDVEKGEKFIYGTGFKFLNRRDFRSPFRIYEENYFYYWGKSIKGNFYDIRVKPYIEFSNRLKLFGGYSFLKSQSFNIYKKSAGYDLNFILKNNSEFENIEFENKKIHRFRFYVEKNFRITPFYSYFYEKDTLNLKKIEEKTGIKLNFDNRNFIYELVSFRYQNKKELKNNFRLMSDFAKYNFKLSASYVIREENEEKRKDFNYYLESNFYPSPFLTMTLISNLIRETGTRKIFEYVFVGEGRGTFSYDSLNKTFYPDPEGSYIKRIREIPLNQGVLKFENEGSIFLTFEKINFNTNAIYRKEESSEFKRYVSFISNLDLNIFLSPYLNFLYIDDINSLFEGVLRNENYDITGGMKRNIGNYVFDSGLNFRKDFFEGFNSMYEKFIYSVFFSLNILTKERDIRVKLSPGYMNFYYKKPETDNFSSPFFEINVHLSSAFLYRTKLFFDLTSLIKKSYEKSFVTNYDRDRWRYSFNLRIERNLTKNIRVLLRTDYRKGSASRPFYNFYIETRLLF